MRNEIFKQRMNKRIKNLKNNENNCYGLPLYVAQEKESDSTLNRASAIREYSKLQRTAEPNIGTIVDYRKENIPFHAGIITKENPYKVLHRNSQNGRLYESNLSELNETLKKAGNISPIYRKPTLQ